ncbi:hypothetical protein Adt_31058 [Abeliophyllum distichum]|uniref:Uncharacterized protein n=1 Tax=Abeliophyllum distichum TaxID=126358 RepID=A0ABD1RD06_9LAMI
MASSTWDSTTIQQAPFTYGASPQLHGLSHLGPNHHSAPFAYRASPQLHGLSHLGLSHHSALFTYGASPQLYGLSHLGFGLHLTSSFCLRSISLAAWPLPLGTRPPFGKLLLHTEHRHNCMASPTWDSATIWLILPTELRLSCMASPTWDSATIRLILPTEHHLSCIASST